MNIDLLGTIDRTLEERNMLRHPFYRAWNDGMLTKDMLKEYACQYYHFVRDFPRMVSAVHSKIPDLMTRQPLLLNLMDEEMGSENHPALWMQFAAALGATEEEVVNTRPLPSTVGLVDVMMDCCRNRSFQEGVASLYAYESQIPEVSRVKIAGLKQFYGITEGDELKFFTVHQEADVHHSQAERDLIMTKTPDRLHGAVAIAAQETAEALWNFLDGVHETYVVPRGVTC
jgi:pyrroloquinoline-quinone synthase